MKSNLSAQGDPCADPAIPRHLPTKMLSSEYMTRLERTLGSVTRRPLVTGAPSTVEPVEIEQLRSCEVLVFTTELGIARIRHHYDRPEAIVAYSPGKGSCYLVFEL